MIGLAVDDDQHTECDAQADEEQPLLPRRMLRNRNQYGIVIGEDGLCLLETDAMFDNVRSCFRRIPREVQIGHDPMYIQRTLHVRHRLGAA